jgi:pimeloyl-ACP methyl ester carboxylesterase
MTSNTTNSHDQRSTGPAIAHRERLLRSVPVTERRLDLAGIPTAVLDGGDGPPVVLLHGPGESAVNWRWTIPDLVTSHRVIAPDLPAHGSSGIGGQPLDAQIATEWLDQLIVATCEAPPVVVGHVLGGAIAARLAVQRPERLERLVLVDSLGLARFRPSPRFALSFVAFVTRPNERSHERFMAQCAYDLDGLRHDLGDDWRSFVEYGLAAARSDTAREAGRLFRTAGIPAIAPEQLDRIHAPTTLIWGRADRANRLRIAERASARHGWPLHIIERAADDPARDQPDAFLTVLRSAIAAGRPDQRPSPRH